MFGFGPKRSEAPPSGKQATRNEDGLPTHGGGDPDAADGRAKAKALLALLDDAGDGRRPKAPGLDADTREWASQLVRAIEARSTEGRSSPAPDAPSQAAPRRSPTRKSEADAMAGEAAGGDVGIPPKGGDEGFTASDINPFDLEPTAPAPSQLLFRPSARRGPENDRQAKGPFRRADPFADIRPTPEREAAPLFRRRSREGSPPSPARRATRLPDLTSLEAHLRVHLADHEVAAEHEAVVAVALRRRSPADRRTVLSTLPPGRAEAVRGILDLLNRERPPGLAARGAG
jgi:hypothetical protein